VSRACQRSGRFLCRMPGLGEVEPQGEINPGPGASAYPVDLSSFRRPWTKTGWATGRPARLLRPPTKEQLRTGTDQGNPTV